MQEQPLKDDVKVYIPDASSKKGLKVIAKYKKHLAAAIIALTLVIGGILVFKAKHQVVFNQAEFNSRVSAYENSGNYNGLVGYLNSLPKNKQTYSILIFAYTAKKDYAAALNVYKTMISKYGNDLNTASGAAATAADAHDYTQALTYYKDALNYEKASSYTPIRGAEEQSFENDIKSLEAQMK